MGVKRIVDTDFWNDIDVIDNFSVEDKFFSLYLITNKYTKQAGIFKLPKKYISFETGYTKEVVEVLLDRFENRYKKIKYNHETQEIAILKYTSFSIIKGGKPVEDCIKKDLLEVEDKSLITMVYKAMEEEWNCSTREFDEKVKTIFYDFSKKFNDNDNDNDNDIFVDVSYNDSYHDSLKSQKQAIVTTSPTNDSSIESINDLSIDSYHDSYNDSKAKNTKNLYYSNVDLDDAIKEFIKHRKLLKKPMTQNAINRFINKLDREFQTDDEKLEAIDLAIIRGWLSVEKAWVENAKRNDRGKIKSIKDSQKDAEERWGGFLNAKQE